MTANARRRCGTLSGFIGFFRAAVTQGALRDPGLPNGPGYFFNPGRVAQNRRRRSYLVKPFQGLRIGLFAIVDPGCAARPWAALCNAFGVGTRGIRVTSIPNIALVVFDFVLAQ